MQIALYALSFILIGISLAATIWVATKPGEEKYDSKSKANLQRLTVIYGVSTVVSILLFVLFLYKV